MTKQGKVLPARRPRFDDGSVLLRSAESIGRVIGTLQRQLDGARGRLSGLADDEDMTRHRHNGSGAAAKATRNAAVRSTARKATSQAKKTAATTKSKRASKSTAARKGSKRTRKSP
jgi:hypothetical protein